MKVVITGGSGLLGRAVTKVFQEKGHQVTALAYSRSGPGLVKLDLRDKPAVEDFFNSEKPDVVVHCAAERRPDVAEKDPQATQQLNVSVTSHLSTLSTSSTSPFFLIYISTDYVFPGNAPPGGYQPSDKVDPTNLYGKTKEEGERVVLKPVKEGNGRAVVLRVPVLYGKVISNDESAVTILLDAVKNSSKQTKMDDWATRYPTHVGDVGKVLEQIAVHYTITTPSTPLPPTLHFSSQSLLTKYTISQILSSSTSPPLPIDHLIPVKEGPDPSKGETMRPKDCHLSNEVLEGVLGKKVEWREFGGWAGPWVRGEEVD